MIYSLLTHVPVFFSDCVDTMIDELPGAVSAETSDGTPLSDAVFAHSKDGPGIQFNASEGYVKLVYPDEKRTTFLSIDVSTEVSAVTVEYFPKGMTSPSVSI